MLIQVNQGDKQAVEKRFLELMGAKDALWAKGEQVWPLSNLEPCTIADFYWHRSSYSFKAEAHILSFKHEEKDLLNKGNIFGHPRWSHAFVYLVDHGLLEGGGFVVLWTYNRMDYNKKPGDALGSKDAEAPCIEVYQWRQCVHDFEEVGPVERRSRGWHVYKCSKCGASHTVDSSD